MTRTFTVDLPNNPRPAAGRHDSPADDGHQGPAEDREDDEAEGDRRVSFAASEAATFVCSVDGRPRRRAPRRRAFKLKLGKHTIEVIAIDSAGNRDATPARVEVKIKLKKKKGGR